jgi:S-sulfo-L-cysteine synthase (3-phospho-L-serine-dependent)
MTGPWLIFIESNTSGTGRLFIRAAAECGYRSALLAAQPDRYSFAQEEPVCLVKCNTASFPELCKSIEKLEYKAPVAGILSSSEYFAATAAALAAEYRLPGPNPVALQDCRNKWKQRRILRAAGLLTPKFERAVSLKETRESLEHIPLPAIVKPVQGSGSVGVRLCRTSEEVDEHAGLLLQRTANERGMPMLPELLIEEYIIGPEFSAEAFQGSVIGITRKHVSAEPFFVELGHDFPAGLPADVDKGIAIVAQDALRALDLTWGPSHIELRLTPNGPLIIEVNPRLAGGFIPEIVRLALGIDVVRETVRLAAGEKPELRSRQRMNASIRFVTPGRNGTIDEISGIAAALRTAGVVDVQMYRKRGDRIQIENDFRDRIGHVVSCAEGSTVAASAAESARNLIGIQLS